MAGFTPLGGARDFYPGSGLPTVEECDPALGPGVSITRAGTMELSWRGVLQWTETLDGGTWRDLNLPICPFPINPSGAMKFYRARQP